MLSFIKKIQNLFNRGKNNWVDEIEAETFFFKKGQEAKAHQLLTENLLLDSLLLSAIEKDASTLANNWIDGKQVHIRENNNFDCTIDYFLPPNPAQHMQAPAQGEPAYQLANTYIEDCLPTSKEMNIKLQALKIRVAGELHKLMLNCAHQPAGIPFAMDVLSAINDQNKAFLFEMNDELKVMQNINLPKEEQDLRNQCSLLADANKANQSKLMRKIAKEAEDIAKCRREILRRQYAILFFGWLQRSLQNWAYTVKKTGALIDYLRQENNLQLAKLLAADATDGISIAAERIDITELVNATKEQNIFSLGSIDDAKTFISSFVAQKISKQDHE